MKLKDTISIITGGGTGIGKALAILLAEQGSTVIVCGRRVEPLNEVVKIIKEKGGQVLALSLDVSNWSQVKQMIDLILSKYGRIDIFVNNAGVAIAKSVIETSEEEWDRINDINLKATFLCSKAVLPFFIKNKKGIIINISSTLGQKAIPNYSAYCASKFGVIGFSQALAEEVRSGGIKVFIVCPAATKTDLHRQLVGEEIAKLAMPPEQVAKKIGDLITGKILLPSGGILIIDNTRLIKKYCRKFKYLINRIKKIIKSI